MRLWDRIMATWGLVMGAVMAIGCMISFGLAAVFFTWVEPAGWLGILVVWIAFVITVGVCWMFIRPLWAK